MAAVRDYPLDLPPPYLRYHNAPPSAAQGSGRAPLVNNGGDSSDAAVISPRGQVQIPRMPTADELAVSTIPESFRCPLCLDILDQPVTTIPCGHTFCEGCILRSLDETGDLSPPRNLPGSSSPTGSPVPVTLCPVCRGRIRKDHIGPCWIVRDLIGNIMIRCDYGVSYDILAKTYESGIPGGCNATFRLSDRVIHLQECPHVMVPCQFARDGCSVMARRGHIPAHEAECSFRSEQCECGARVLSQFLDEHQQHCPSVVVTCPNNSYGCALNFPRGSLSEHLAQCPFEAVKDVIAAKDKEIQRLRSENLKLECSLSIAHKAAQQLESKVAQLQQMLDRQAREDHPLSALPAAYHQFRVQQEHFRASAQQVQQPQPPQRSRQSGRKQHCRFLSAEESPGGTRGSGPKQAWGDSRKESFRDRTGERNTSGDAAGEERVEDREDYGDEESDLLSPLSPPARRSCCSAPPELNYFPDPEDEFVPIAEAIGGPPADVSQSSRQQLPPVASQQSQYQAQPNQQEHQLQNRQQSAPRLQSMRVTIPQVPKPGLARTVSTSPRRKLATLRSASLRDPPQARQYAQSLQESEQEGNADRLVSSQDRESSVDECDQPSQRERENSSQGFRGECHRSASTDRELHRLGSLSLKRAAGGSGAYRKSASTSHSRPSSGQSSTSRSQVAQQSESASTEMQQAPPSQLDQPLDLSESLSFKQELLESLVRAKRQEEEAAEREAADSDRASATAETERTGSPSPPALQSPHSQSGFSQPASRHSSMRLTRPSAPILEAATLGASHSSSGSSVVYRSDIDLFSQAGLMSSTLDSTWSPGAPSPSSPPSSSHWRREIESEYPSLSPSSMRETFSTDSLSASPVASPSSGVSASPPTGSPHNNPSGLDSVGRARPLRGAAPDRRASRLSGAPGRRRFTLGGRGGTRGCDGMAETARSVSEGWEGARASESERGEGRGSETEREMYDRKGERDSDRSMTGERGPASGRVGADLRTKGSHTDRRPDAALVRPRLPRLRVLLASEDDRPPDVTGF